MLHCFKLGALSPSTPLPPPHPPPSPLPYHASQGQFVYVSELKHVGPFTFVLGALTLGTLLPPPPHVHLPHCSSTSVTCRHRECAQPYNQPVERGRQSTDAVSNNCVC